MAHQWLQIFSTDGFRKMWKAPEEFREHLLIISEVIRSKSPASLKALENPLFAKGLTAGLSGVLFDQMMKSCLQRVDKILKFIQHALGNGADQSTTKDDVLYLLEYKGNALDAETDLRHVVKTTPAWNSICDEVVRTAKSSTKLRPVLERVIESLKASAFNLTPSRLGAILDEMRELKNGMRKQDMNFTSSEPQKCWVG